MNQSHRVCKMKDHDELPIFHICTVFECNQPKRWSCSECISQEIHKHNKPNNSHIMNTKELLIKLKGEAEKFKENIDGHKTIQQLQFFQEMLKECLILENSLIDYRKYIERQILNKRQQQENFQQYIKNLVSNIFENLDDIELNKQLKINLYQFNENQQLLPVDNIKQQVYKIEQKMKKYQKNWGENNNKIIDLSKSKYITQQIDQSIQFTDYYGSSISKNKQYLAYGGDDRELKIYDMQQNKIIKQIKLKLYFLWVCQFTEDSSQLYIALNNSVYGYNVQDDFKEIYEKQIHLADIFNIITIQNEYLLTCSGDKSIVKTNIKSNQQIFKLTGHTSWIKAIDYNDKDEIIVSGSGDKSIKLWNCKNLSIIIDQQQAHNNDIRQIQLINNNLKILSLDCDGNLYKWKIDLINKNLVKLLKISDQNRIYNFYQVNQDQNLLLICNYQAKILNQQGEIINTVEHGGKLSRSYNCRQLDNLQYIQIICQDKIFLAISQD